MPDLKNSGDFTSHAYESLLAEAESLRQRVGQENVNQSSVLASRRLDEALLRLDLAAGRRRDSSRSLISGGESVQRDTAATNHQTIQPRLTPARASDLELDESIQQSSSIWLEANDEERTKYRFDEPASEIQPPTTRLRNSASHTELAPAKSASAKSASSVPEPINLSVDTEPAGKTIVPVSAPEIPVSMIDATKPDSWAMFFTSPIDVMISTLIEPRHETPLKEPAASLIENPLDSPVESPSDIPVETSIEIATAEAAANENGPIEATHRETVQVKTAAPLEAVSPKTSPDESMSTDRETSRPVQEKPEGIGEQSRPSFDLEPFQATWQVDEFVVPSVVDELFLGGSIAEQLASRLATARQDGLRTIAVTSAKSGEGRSTVAMGMALSVAFSGLKVAIVDADPEGVRLATDLHLDLDQSWLDCVRQRLPLEEAAVHSEADSLTLIPMLDRDDEPAMDYTDLRLLLRKLKACFDLVVIDCGMSAFAEVGLCDTALIVRDVHRTKALEVETLARSLRRSGVQGVGVIENFCQG